MTTLTKDIFATKASDFSTMSNRNKNTIATAIGAVAGVGISALSDRSNATTITSTALFGGLLVAGVYNNEVIHAITPDGTGSKAILTTTAVVETALFGCLMNAIAGSDVTAE